MSLLEHAAQTSQPGGMVVVDDELDEDDVVEDELDDDAVEDELDEEDVVEVVLVDEDVGTTGVAYAAALPEVFCGAADRDGAAHVALLHV